MIRGHCKLWAHDGLMTVTRGIEEEEVYICSSRTCAWETVVGTGRSGLFAADYICQDAM
jgi:hypothetical protein